MNPVLVTQAPPAYKTRWVDRLGWLQSAHPYQVAPSGDWVGWVMMGGRGAGKTLAGSRDCANWITTHRDHRYAIVAPTWGDARDIAVEGETGVLNVLHSMGYDPTWNRSLGELLMPNGSRADIYGAKEADRLRGPQWHRAWLEELAVWLDAHKGDVVDTAFNNLTFGLRLGDNPQYIVTTTPRRVTLLRDLVARPNVRVTKGSTIHNLANLAPTYHDIIARYEGTTLGRQEVYGELIEEVEGAYWTTAMLEAGRLTATPQLRRVVVGVDPPGAIAECGIVAVGEIAHPCPCGRRPDRTHYAVLGDYSLRSTPEGWAAAVAAAAAEWGAHVAAEQNYGGPMVAAVLRQVGITPHLVTASRGKEVRAEPAVLLYEQGVAHHIGLHPTLEDELTTWTRDGGWSPNRLDALVWAFAELATHPRRHLTVSPSPGALPIPR